MMDKIISIGETIYGYITTPLIGGLSLLGLFIFLLENPDRYDSAKAFLIRPFKRLGKKVQQQYLASDIQGKLNRFSRHIIKDMDEQEGFRAKIQWVEDSTKDAFFEQDKIIIKMDCSDNANKNLALATLAYTSEVIIRKTKPYMDPNLREATNLIAAKRIMDNYANSQERDYYNNVYLYPKLESDQELKNDCNKLSVLDQKGYFTRIYLRELRHLGELLDGSIPTDQAKEETKNFSEYLSKISMSPSVHSGGEFLNSGDFHFNGRYLKIQVLLLANSGNVHKQNLRPYIKRIKDGLKNDYEIFYILSVERSFDFLKAFKKDLERRLVNKNILKLTCDRTFYLKKKPRLKEKHRCLIYRKVGAYDESIVREIFEDIPDYETNTTN